MLSSRFRAITAPYISFLAKPFVKMGLSPNALTVIGLVFSVIAGVMYALHNLIFASLALLFTSLFDVLDGAVARLSKKETAFGGFLDSVLDRYSDAAILIGLAIYLQTHYILIFIVLVGSMLVSYTRARAEQEIERCDSGFGERAERLIILIAATVIEALNLREINIFYWSLILLAVLTHLTVAQRIWHTYTVLKE